jgi:hypothetical protein
MDRAAEDSMSDDTHALLADPSRPTCDVVLMESYDSMDRRRALRRAIAEYVEVEETHVATMMVTVGEGSGEYYLVRRRHLRLIFASSRDSEGFVPCH